MGLSRLQERVAEIVRSLPDADGFALAGGAAMAAHDVLDRTTRDLDFFGSPGDVEMVHRLAGAFQAAAEGQGLQVARKQQTEVFVRLHVHDGEDETEVDFGVDYRALDPVHTRYGDVLDASIGREGEQAGAQRHRSEDTGREL